MTFTYQDREFLLDGKPYQVISGAMHYFRIPRAYWRDRLLKLKEGGFNTVETYTCWNLHEKEEGVFDFSDMLDVEAYVALAEELGLNVILRPGPYICAEWEFGGLPAWLLRYEEMELRCYDEVFLSKVRRYYTALFDQLRGHLSTNGGRIIMVQIENEYGSYGNDKKYLRAIADMYIELGVNCQLYTSDGAKSYMLNGGTLPDYPCVANFGSNPAANFAALEKFRPGQPTMCGEFWCGWFDHWGEEHHTRTPEEQAALTDEMLACGASLNFYMFHGGTNFGFMNGANYFDDYLPTITSYDYCALLSEAGDLTPGYHAVRRVIEERTGKKLPPLTVKNSEKAAYGAVTLNRSASLLAQASALGETVHSAAPKYMEDLGQNWGFTLYSTTVTGPQEALPLRFDVCNDRASIFINGEFRGIQERGRGNETMKLYTGAEDGEDMASAADSGEIKLPLAAGESVRLDILCENMGRVNYGTKLRDRKGLRGIRFERQYHYGWDMIPLPMTNLEKLTFTPHEGGAPACTFLAGTLTIEGAPKDTFVRLDGFCHGFVTVNGFNLGRYYNTVGPQKTLYVPAPMLREGDNEIIVFETDGCDTNVITFVDTPDLG